MYIMYLHTKVLLQERQKKTTAKYEIRHVSASVDSWWDIFDIEKN